nr:hypothetical protein [Neoroseomonas eburnea]
MPDTGLARLTRDLLRDLARAGVDGHTATGIAGPGERGAVADLTGIVLDRLAGGTVTAIVECLKAYFIREPSFSLTIRRPDGAEVKVEARNVASAEVAELFRAAGAR